MTIKNVRDRPTPELIVIFLTGIVGLVLVLITALILILEVTTGGDADTNTAVSAIRGITSTMIAAVIGYLAGTRSRNGNGKQLE